MRQRSLSKTLQVRASSGSAVCFDQAMHRLKAADSGMATRRAERARQDSNCDLWFRSLDVGLVDRQLSRSALVSRWAEARQQASSERSTRPALPLSREAVA